MILLIDYDNVDLLVRRHGPRHVVDRVLQVLGTWQDSWARRVLCRLYGGWFDALASSRNAEHLIPDLERQFPSPFPVVGHQGTQAVLVRAELARSLACDRDIDLTHTYRRRSLPPRLQCESPPFADCVSPRRCGVAAIRPFVKERCCPVEGCGVRPDNVLSRAEQKLVDSMLIVDLIHYAETAGEPLVVVSADEDLWPGIRFALLRNARVMHVIPRRGHTDRERYRRLETGGYSRFEI